MAWVTLAIAPVLVLLVFQFKFLPYHSHFVTWTHRLLILIELATMIVLWPLALDPELDIDWSRAWRSPAAPSRRSKPSPATAWPPFMPCSGTTWRSTSAAPPPASSGSRRGWSMRASPSNARRLAPAGNRGAPRWSCNLLRSARAPRRRKRPNTHIRLRPARHRPNPPRPTPTPCFAYQARQLLISGSKVRAFAQGGKATS